jgi:hypothetical protein
MTKYTFELDNYSSKIEMQEFDDIAQIFVNDKLIAEYKFGGAGCSVIYEADPKKLIDTLVGVLYDQASVSVEEDVQEGFPS